MAATNIYLKLDGLDGESMDDDHIGPDELLGPRRFPPARGLMAQAPRQRRGGAQFQLSFMTPEEEDAGECGFALQ